MQDAGIGGKFTFSMCGPPGATNRCATEQFEIPVSSSSVEFVNNNVKLVANALAAWQWYKPTATNLAYLKVELSSGAIETTSNVAFGGLSGFAYSFAVKDNNAPEICQPTTLLSRSFLPLPQLAEQPVHSDHSPH